MDAHWSIGSEPVARLQAPRSRSCCRPTAPSRTRSAPPHGSPCCTSRSGSGWRRAWLGLRRRGRRAVAEPPPAPVLEPPTPPAKAGAIGYLCVSAAANGDLREQTAAITACCDERGLRPACRSCTTSSARAATTSARRWPGRSSSSPPRRPRRSWSRACATSRAERRQPAAAAELVQRATAHGWSRSTSSSTRRPRPGGSPRRRSPASAAGSTSGSPSAPGAGSRPRARAAPARGAPPSPTSRSCRSGSRRCASRA